MSKLTELQRADLTYIISVGFVDFIGIGIMLFIKSAFTTIPVEFYTSINLMLISLTFLIFGLLLKKAELRGIIKLRDYEPIPYLVEILIDMVAGSLAIIAILKLL